MGFSIQQLMQMIRGGQNPQQVILNQLAQSSQSSPLAANLLTLAKNGQTAQLEEIARNICKERGLNYDEEIKSFRNKLGL